MLFFSFSFSVSSSRAPRRTFLVVASMAVSFYRELTMTTCTTTAVGSSSPASTVTADKTAAGSSSNVLMCRQWWKVCWMYGDQEKYYRQLYGAAKKSPPTSGAGGGGGGVTELRLQTSTTAAVSRYASRPQTADHDDPRHQLRHRRVVPFRPDDGHHRFVLWNVFRN